MLVDFTNPFSLHDSPPFQSFMPKNSTSSNSQAPNPDEIIALMASLMKDDLHTPSVNLTTDDALPSSDLRKKLVIKLPSHRDLSIHVLKELLQIAWKPTADIIIKEFYDGAYLVNFKELVDLDAVIVGAPWFIKDDLLFFERCASNKLPSDYTFTKSEFCIQLHGLPIDYLTPSAVHKIASQIGPTRPILDEETLNWGRYASVKVELDITNALPKFIKTTLDNGRPCWVDLKYEKLSKICYFCGYVDHQQQHCSLNSSLREAISEDWSEEKKAQAKSLIVPKLDESIRAEYKSENDDSATRKSILMSTLSDAPVTTGSSKMFKSATVTLLPRDPNRDLDSSFGQKSNLTTLSAIQNLYSRRKKIFSKKLNQNSNNHLNSTSIIHPSPHPNPPTQPHNDHLVVGRTDNISNHFVDPNSSTIIHHHPRLNQPTSSHNDNLVVEPVDRIPFVFLDPFPTFFHSHQSFPFTQNIISTKQTQQSHPSPSPPTSSPMAVEPTNHTSTTLTSQTPDSLNNCKTRKPLNKVTGTVNPSPILPCISSSTKRRADPSSSYSPRKAKKKAID